MDAARKIVKEPEFDKYGYPTDRTLNVIKRWKIKSFEDCTALLEYCQKAWNYPDYFKRSKRRRAEYKGWKPEYRWEVHTVGWSGNESIISALHTNWMFWTLCFYSEKRGGHYVFRTR